MRHTIFITILLVLAAQFAMAGAGNDQPTNITVTNPYSNNINWAQICWNTNNPSDSLVMLGENLDFSRQIYDTTITTNHCVVVKNLQPNNTYYYSVASCTDPVGGQPCVRTDSNWSVAPWPTTTPNFTTVQSTSGPIAYSAFAFGPNYVYQGSTINVPISILQTSGVVKPTYLMVIAEASIDGISCLPGTGLGNTCGNTGIALAMLCNGNRELVNPATNNYPVNLVSGQPYNSDYSCYDLFGEPAMEARIVANGGQLHASSHGRASTLSHTLRLIFQVVDVSQQKIPIGDPVKLTYQFSIVPPAQFKVTAPTSFPPIPNYSRAIFTAAKWGPQMCSNLMQANSQGIYLNADFNANSSNSEAPGYWDTYTYDGNRVFKETGERFDGVTGGQWQPNHAYSPGDLIVANGYTQVNISPGNSGSNPPAFNPNPGGTTLDWGTSWTNAGNKAYWTQCSEIIGMQYLNWAVSVAKWAGSDEWNIFPWGMYMDYLRQGDVLNENCNGGPTCSGLNALSDWRFGANILTYPTPGFVDENFVFTYYPEQSGTVRALPYNVNVLLVNWLETGVQPTNELKARVDLLLQTIGEVAAYNPLDGPNHYKCCYSAPNYNVGLWAMTLINTYNVQAYLGAQPDARIPIELMKLMDWFYSTQVNLLGNDNSFPYEPFTIPYNCSIFDMQNCTAGMGGLNNLVAPAYAWLGAVYGDSCTLPTSGSKCWDAADLLFSKAVTDGWQGGPKNYNQLYQDFSNYIGWRTGTMPGTDSYVLPPHNPLGNSYPDVIGPYPSGAYPAKPTAGNITNSGATITWYTYERAVSTVVRVGTDPNNINIETDCGPSVYTNTDNLWINTCHISGLQSSTFYYFGVGGTDAASNFAFSAVDPTNNLYGDWFNFTTTQ
jgi:hypothetical protein